jgi:hypothetical protein
MKNSQNDYEKEKDTSALGFCPECKQPFKYLNIGSDQMAYCHQCQTKYKAGVNMFSTWLDEQEADWRRNQKRLANYRTVKPLEEPPDEPDPAYYKLVEPLKKTPEEPTFSADELKTISDALGYTIEEIERIEEKPNFKNGHITALMRRRNRDLARKVNKLLAASDIDSDPIDDLPF